jgi:cysteine synthase
LGLKYVADTQGIQVHCVVDPTVSAVKMKRMREAGIVLEVAELNGHPDYRSARIARARAMEEYDHCVWVNQYANFAGLLAHLETTATEIWHQTEGLVDVVVCSVGSGGTICGIGRALKDKNPKIQIFGVEPEGSTIFGGSPGPYISAGAGFRGPSDLVSRYGSVVDYSSHVADKIAFGRCRQCLESEGISVGISTGAALEIGIRLAQSSQRQVVVIAPDSGQDYPGLMTGDWTVACEQGLAVQQIRIDPPGPNK